MAVFSARPRFNISGEQDEAHDGEPRESPEFQQPLGDVAPGELQTKADVLDKLNETMEAFVIRLLSENGGRLRQKEFAVYTGWSASQTSRYLTELEEENVIIRISIGKEKVVFLPETAPADPRDRIDTHRD